jgi:hypothetical protein
MRSFLSFTVLSSVMVFGLAACSSFADPPDEIASDSAEEASPVGGADNVDGSHTYFAIRTDLRKCAFPTCGGWFLHRLNQPLTRCHDGQYAAMCYTPVLDWSKAGLSEALQGKLLDAARQGALSGDVDAIVRGRFLPTNRTTPDPSLGRFVITEAWQAEGSVPAQGVFVRVRDNGLRCLVAPCPSITETTLNTSLVTDIAEIDWTSSGLSDREVSAQVATLSMPGGVLIAGDRFTVSGPGGTAKARTATAVYARLSDPAP